ncbi:hypothetical protein [Corynebacterium mayonis]|uniref:hypothetical protein n=1 Tax=Corynebacterium mayonis TaxID=3062461 RepID=UPI003140806D
MSETSPVTLDRARELFRANGWKFQESDSPHTFYTGFYGVTLEVHYAAPNVNMVTTVAVDVIGVDRFPDVLSWAEGFNASHTFPSVFALKDPARDKAALGVSYALPGYWEYSDKQFADHVSTGIQGIITAVTEFLAEFAPAVLQQLDLPGGAGD